MQNIVPPYHFLCHSCNSYIEYSICDRVFVCEKCDKSIDVIDWHQVNGHYFRLEENMLDFLDYVIYTPDHENVFSPKLFDIYLQIGAGIEQIFMLISKWDGFNHIDEIELLRSGEIKTGKKVRSVNIVDYLKNFDEPFRLKKIYMNLNYPVFVFEPFKDIDISGNGPVWPDFNLYSRFKHEWFHMMRKTQLENTIRFLGAYFTIMCVNPFEGNYEYLISKDILTPGPRGMRVGNYPREIARHRADELVRIRRWIKDKELIKYQFEGETSIFQSNLFTLSYPLISKSYN